LRICTSHLSMGSWGDLSDPGSDFIVAHDTLQYKACQTDFCFL